jgi:A/G-specific adenine glycosylase
MLIDLHRDFSSLLDNNQLTKVGIAEFQRYVYDIYYYYRRVFPWRETTEPYNIVVSEIMLQQTQVQRVHTFYTSFTQAFPHFGELAQASLRDVLTAWTGLGYNRRAVSLHKIAEIVANQYQGQLPDTVTALQQLPGIGPHTAGSIAAFAFNKPSIFIETNIRTVFLHLFFRDQTLVPDSLLLPLVEQTVDHHNPRHWYYALMDYGTLLKQTVPNPNRKSKHYAIQSKFIGSDRRVRGAIVRHLTQTTQLTHEQLQALLLYAQDPVATSPEQCDRVIEQLCNEKILVNKNGSFGIY